MCKNSGGLGLGEHGPIKKKLALEEPVEVCGVVSLEDVRTYFIFDDEWKQMML